MKPNALFDVVGRVAVVTGASSGLGRSMAQALSDAGARVVLAARRVELLEPFAESLRAAGGEALAVGCDVRRAEDVDTLVTRAFDAFDRVDVLVNNAGITRVVPAEDEGEDSWSDVLATNLTGVFLPSQRFGRRMLEAGSGSIVNVASILGLVGCGQIAQASYAASKGGVVNLTRELAAQWARRGVRVNCIAPGWFESEMTADAWEDERSLQWMQRNAPMGRTGRDGELTGALLYFASDASSFVTGQTLAVDGGWSAV